MRLRFPTIHLPSSRREIIVSLTLFFAVLTLLTFFVFWPYWRESENWRLAEEAVERRDFTQALEYLERYAQFHTDSPAGFFFLARTSRRADELRKAEQYLSRAAALGWIPEQIALEQTLLHVQQEGAREPASESLRKLLAAGHPDEKIILEALFVGARKVLNLHQCKHWLTVWMERFPTDPQPVAWRAKLHESMAQFEAARKDYEKLQELRPQDREVLLRLGVLAFSNGSDCNTAEKHLKEYLASDPNNQEARLTLAKCARVRGEFEKAEELLEKILRDTPNEPEAILLRAGVEGDMGRNESALQWLARAEKAGAEPQTVNYQFATTLQRLGKKAEAEPYQQKFLKYQKANEDLDHAIGEILKDPQNADRYYDVGRLYAILQKDESAVRWFQNALRYNNDHVPSHEALIDLFTRQRNYADAIVHREYLKGRQKK